MRLDVHHVADAKRRVVIEPRTRIGPVEGFRARAAGRSQVFLEIEPLTGIPTATLKMSDAHIFKYARRGRADLAAG